MMVMTTDKLEPWIAIDLCWDDWRFDVGSYRIDYGYQTLNYTRKKAVKLRKMGMVWIGPFAIRYGDGEQQWIANDAATE